MKVFDIYYQLLMQQLTNGKRTTIDLSTVDMQDAIEKVEEQIDKNGSGNLNDQEVFNDEYENFLAPFARRNKPNPYRDIKPDSNTIGSDNVSRYDYSKACRKELMKKVEWRVRQELEWRNAAIRIGLKDADGNALDVNDHTWMSRLMKTDGTPESRAYNESIVALAALVPQNVGKNAGRQKPLWTREQYLDWRIKYYTDKGEIDREAWDKATSDLNDASTFLFREINAELKRADLDHFEVAMNAILTGDFSNEFFQDTEQEKRLEKAFAVFNNDVSNLGMVVDREIFKALNALGNVPFNSEQQKKFDKIWQEKVHYIGNASAVANLAANPYFAFVDPYKQYRSKLGGLNVSFDPDGKNEDRVKKPLGGSMLEEYSSYVNLVMYAHDKFLAPYKLDTDDKISKEFTKMEADGIQVFHNEKEKKTMIVQSEPTNAGFVSIKPYDHPEHIVSNGMKERANELLAKCAQWSTTKRTSPEFENMRKALGIVSAIEFADHPTAMQIEEARAALAYLNDTTKAYFRRKAIHHNDNAYESERIRFANDVKGFVEQKLRHCQYYTEHMQAVAPARAAQQAEPVIPVEQQANINENNIINNNLPEENIELPKPEKNNEPPKPEENNEPPKQEENIEPPKDEVKAEPVDAPKPEVKAEPNVDAPKNEAQPNVDAPKNEAEQNVNAPQDEVKAEPVDAQKNENDNEPNNGKPDYVDAWVEVDVYAINQVSNFMAMKKAYDALKFPDNRKSMEYRLRDVTGRALAGYVIRELISSEEDEPNTEPLVTQLVNKGKMNVLVDKIINSEPFNSQLKQVLTHFGTAEKFFENIPSNLEGSLKDHWKTPSKIMERNMCLKAGTQFLAKFKKELELEKQKKPEVKKEQSVNAQKNDNKERKEENKNATNGAQAAAEKYAKGNIGVFTTMKRGYDRLKSPAMRKSMVKDMLDYAQNGIAGYIILELISKSKEPNADVKSTITQLANGGKLNELSDEIIKSEQFDNYFGKVIKDFDACTEFLSRLQDNPSSDARKCCFMAGMHFVKEFKKGPQKKEAENNAKDQIVNAPKNEAKEEPDLEKQKKPEVKKEQSANAQKNDNKEREEENKNATNGAQAAAEKYAKGNIGVFTTMKRGYDRLKSPAMRKSMVKDMLDYAQNGIAGYIILELISKSKEPNADVKSTITQLANGGKLNELSDEIIKSEQFDNYFGKVIKDFDACTEFLSRLQDNPSSDARKCCFMAGMDFVEEFKKGPQKKEAENNAKEQIVNTASEKNGKESQMQGKVSV